MLPNFPPSHQPPSGRDDDDDQDDDNDDDNDDDHRTRYQRELPPLKWHYLTTLHITLSRVLIL